MVCNEVLFVREIIVEASTNPSYVKCRVNICTIDIVSPV